jgi:4-amino-4-deoxy-L-arabinose transferase-like glycosyltransferase
VWHWREWYPLGGDESEYFQQALTLLREHRYVELRLMRPPLSGFFLAGAILLVDSLVQQLRLVQVLLSAATVVPVWLLTRELMRWHRPTAPHAPPLLAALLCALSYTLAFYATQLLAETLFLAGLSVFFWLLLRAGAPGGPRLLSACAAGLVLAAVCLTRSVALVLLPLGALWLLAVQRPLRRAALVAPLLFALGALLLLLPWTARNYASYGAVILIDTTGAENLWLDNDPAGREAVKAQLYALGDDRAARQQLASRRGMQAIIDHPQHVLRKASGELTAFFALEHSDDMLQRPVIWLPPAEVWARLLLGDALWLLLLLAGLVGLCAAGNAARPPPAPRWQHWLPTDPRWLVAAWALYTLLTGLLFHVELRYRLPLYPVLLPYAALALASGWQWLTRPTRPPPRRTSAAALLVLLALALTLLHRPYPLLAWHLGSKHAHLTRAERALEAGQHQEAARAAQAALSHDEDSILARVALARAARMAGNAAGAAAHLREAIDILPDHPLPHLLLGDLLRQQGQRAEARQHLAYEAATLQDVQRWSWSWFTTPPTSTLDVGGGLDLGHIQGFHLAEQEGPQNGTTWRWSTGSARLRLAVPSSSTTQPPADRCPADSAGSTWLLLRLAAGRPPGAPAPRVSARIAGQPAHVLTLANGWQDYLLPLPNAEGSVTVHIESTTFLPYWYKPGNADGRILGIMVEKLEIVQCPPMSRSPDT